MMRLFALALAGCTLLAGCAEPRATDPVQRGRQVYREKNCAACHRIGGDGGTQGPALTHVATAAETRDPSQTAAEYLRRSVEDPGAYVVPGYPDAMPRGLTRGLSDDDLDALVRFLLTLR